MPQKHAKTFLMSEVSTDREVSGTLSRMSVIRKEDLYGMLVELSNLHKPGWFSGVNLWVECMLYA